MAARINKQQSNISLAGSRTEVEDIIHAVVLRYVADLQNGKLTPRRAR